MKGFDPGTGLGFRQNGEFIDVTLPYARTSGQGVQIGTGLFGVCINGGASGASDVIATEGVFGLLAATGAANDGDIAYWDNTAKAVTSTASTNLRVGQFIGAKAANATVATVRLYC